jgi:hypothetical protein
MSRKRSTVRSTGSMGLGSWVYDIVDWSRPLVLVRAANNLWDRMGILDLIWALDLMTDGPQQVGRRGRCMTVAHGGAMACQRWLTRLEPRERYGTLNSTRFVPMGSQQTGIPFSLPSSDGGQCGERTVVASFTQTRPTAWGSSGDSPAWPRPRVASPRLPLASTGGESVLTMADYCAWRLLGSRSFGQSWAKSELSAVLFIWVSTGDRRWQGFQQLYNL